MRCFDGFDVRNEFKLYVVGKERVVFGGFCIKKGNFRDGFLGCVCIFGFFDR